MIALRLSRVVRAPAGAEVGSVVVDWPPLSDPQSSVRLRGCPQQRRRPEHHSKQDADRDTDVTERQPLPDVGHAELMTPRASSDARRYCNGARPAPRG